MGRRPGRKSGTKEKTIKYFDYTLLFVIIFLVCFGLVMLYSTSSYNAQIEYGDGTHYLKRQAFACCLGFAAMFVISKIDYHVWKRLYGVAYIGAFLLCVSVIFWDRMEMVLPDGSALVRFLSSHLSLQSLLSLFFLQR